MRIGIIGAGFHRPCPRFARRQKRPRCDDRQLARAADAGQHRGGDRVQGGHGAGAAEFGDAVVVATPFAAYCSVPVVPLMGKPVLDANNYYPDRDGHIAELDQEEATTSEMLAARLVGAHVVRAFNAILQQNLAAGGTPPSTPGRRALPIAGNAADAMRAVAGLHDQFGYDVVDAGPLSERWRFQRAMLAILQPS